MSAFVTINKTPVNDKITPKIWNRLVFSIYKNDAKKSIQTGIVDIIKTPFSTWVKLSE